MEKQFIREGVIRSEIENFLRRELDSAGYSGINIQKTPLSTRMTLYVEKPPLVIGRKGERIEKLTNILKERYNLDNPSIDVQKVENPTLDPNIVARRIVSALERGMPRRRVAYKALKAVMDSGAKGIEIALSGKIIGKGGRSRVEKYSEGYMKKAGDSTKLVKRGLKQAYLKAGVIGVTVRIVPPDVIFPDDFHVIDKKKEVKEEVKVPEAATSRSLEGRSPEGKIKASKASPEAVRAPRGGKEKPQKKKKKAEAERRSPEGKKAKKVKPKAPKASPGGEKKKVTKKKAEAERRSPEGKGKKPPKK